MTATILITSAGSLVCDALLRCLAKAPAGVTIVGVNSVAAPVAFGCQRLHRVPPTAEAAAHQMALRRIIARERPDLVLPGRDEDVPALAALAACGEFARTVFPVPPPALTPVFFDKRRTHRFAQDHALPFAPSAQTPAQARALASAHGYPLLAKPWHGAASRRVFVLRDAGELEKALDAEGLMIQAFLGKEALAGQDWGSRIGDEGMPWRRALVDEETTAEMIIGPSGQVSAMCLDRGTTAPPLRTAIRRLADEAVAEVGLAWARALAAQGHRGPVNIQGKRLADGRFVPYEVGARFGGTSVARAALGRDLVSHMVAEILGWPPPAFVDRPGAINLATRRTTVPAAWWDDFETVGEWQAPPNRGAFPEFREPPAPEGTPASPLGDRVVLAPLGDRVALANFARRHGLPFAPLAATVEAGLALLAMGGGVALIVKPRHGDGPIRLVEGPDEVVAALALGENVAQVLLAPETLAAQREAWATRAGAPWDWAVSDTVETAEADIADNGPITAIRVASIRQRGGAAFELRPLDDPAITAGFGRWARALGREGHRGPLRITGKRGADGAWIPFSLSPRPLDLPVGAVIETRVLVPAPAPAP